MDESPLNDLPAEIRIRIYEFALLMPNGIWLWQPSKTKRPDFDSDDPAQKRDSLALISTCKQVRREALPVLFGSNTIEVNCAAFDGPPGIRTGMARRASDMIYDYPFSRYMKLVEVRLGTWVLPFHRHQNAAAAAVKTFQHFSRAFPNPKTQLSCSFYAQSLLATSRDEMTHKTTLRLQISRGHPDSLIISTKSAEHRVRRAIRSLDAETRQRFFEVARDCAKRLRWLARIMAKDPMWMGAQVGVLHNPTDDDLSDGENDEMSQSDDSEVDESEDDESEDEEDEDDQGEDDEDEDEEEEHENDEADA